MSGISKRQVSRLCEEIDGRVNAFLERPIEGDWPYVWMDATYIKVRRAGRIVSVGDNNDGRREVLGMAIRHSEADLFWTDFLRSRARRGLRGVRLVISDSHEASRHRSPRSSAQTGSAAVFTSCATLSPMRRDTLPSHQTTTIKERDFTSYR